MRKKTTPRLPVLSTEQCAVRALEEALNSPAFKHNALARAIFERRITSLRLETYAGTGSHQEVRYG